MVMADMDGEFTFSSGGMKTDSLSLSEKSIPLMDKECQLSHHRVGQESWKGQR